MRRGGLVVGSVLALVVFAGPSLAGPTPQPATGDGQAAAAPEIGRVWLRVPKSGGIKRAATRAGQLELGDDALRFIGRKQTIELPLSSLRTVSFGRMDGDVDTEWTVLEVDDGERRALYGLRDGSKLGFGQRTPAIHERVIDTVRRLRMAQYDVPDGSRVFDTFDWQFTVALPDGWAARIGEMVYVGDRAPWGSVLFLAGDAVSDVAGGGVDDSLFERLRDAQVPAVTIERRQAPRGARCAGFAERSRRAIVAHLVESRLGDPAFEQPESLEELPAAVDGCAALRMTAEDTAGRTIEMHAVAFRDVLFLVGLRHGSGGRGAFETALATLRFAKAF